MPTKSDEIRRLLAQGKSRAEIARILGTSYQMVYQVDKKRRDAPSSQASRPSSGMPAYQNRGFKPLGGSQLPGFRYPDSREPPKGLNKRGPLRSGPTQQRIAIQDGHEVVAIQEAAEVVCARCKLPVQFSLKWLAYVHTKSVSPVTQVQDMQAGRGLFDG